MPSEYCIDLKHRLVVSRGTGVFHFSDYAAHAAQVREDPRFDPSFNHLVDCRDFESLELSAEQLRLAAALSNFDPQARRAFVAGTQLQYGLSRMLAAFAQFEKGQQPMVFRTLAEALDWLGLPVGYDPERLPNPVPVGGSRPVWADGSGSTT